LRRHIFPKSKPLCLESTAEDYYNIESFISQCVPENNLNHNLKVQINPDSSIQENQQELTTSPNTEKPAIQPRHSERTIKVPGFLKDFQLF